MEQRICCAVRFSRSSPLLYGNTTTTYPSEPITLHHTHAHATTTQAARLDAQGRKEEASAVRTASAVAARSSMLRLGPTFIKLGQLLSTRVDLLAPEYIEVGFEEEEDV